MGIVGSPAAGARWVNDLGPLDRSSPQLLSCRRWHLPSDSGRRSFLTFALCLLASLGLTFHLLPPFILPQAREKEKMKEAKDARYTNGHLFTTISVSGMTMCYACNKSITAKEALICPSKCGGDPSVAWTQDFCLCCPEARVLLAVLVP